MWLRPIRRPIDMAVFGAGRGTPMNQAERDYHADTASSEVYAARSSSHVAEGRNLTAGAGGQRRRRPGVVRRERALTDRADRRPGAGLRDAVAAGGRPGRASATISASAYRARRPTCSHASLRCFRPGPAWIICKTGWANCTGSMPDYRRSFHGRECRP